jgi:hypothetical protein
LLSSASEAVALELIAATIRAQMLDFFDDHGWNSFQSSVKVRLNHYPTAKVIYRSLKLSLPARCGSVALAVSSPFDYAECLTEKA